MTEIHMLSVVAGLVQGSQYVMLRSRDEVVLAVGGRERRGESGGAC